MSTPSKLAWRRCLLLVVALVAGSAGAAAAATPASAPTPQQPVKPAVPPVPGGLPAAIEPLSPYLPQRSCDYHAKPGVVAFADLLARTYPDSHRGRIVTTCLRAGRTSEHAEGRALDWSMSARDPHQAAEVGALLGWLLAGDGRGNRAAMARRLGVMYVIWNARIWGAYAADKGWQPYRCAGVTACHMDHVHVSFGWAGAWKRTSYWTRQVAAVDRGPCVAAGQRYAPLWSRPNPSRCPQVPALPAATTDLALMRQDQNLVVVQGDAGAPVKVIQRQVGALVDGRYGPATVARTASWQRAHGLPPSGLVGPGTWRAFMRPAA
jgi:peptidoglycan hydrolase-like protein with peptidoglycan-binding domain